MTRFFFSLVSKGNRIVDTKGREFDDLAAAHRHAILLINKMVYADWQGWSIDVTDVSDRSVLSVLFPQMSYAQQRGNKAGALPKR